MRLRERVNQFTFDSSSEDDAGDAQDEDFQPEDDGDEGAGAAGISLLLPSGDALGFDDGCLQGAPFDVA